MIISVKKVNRTIQMLLLVALFSFVLFKMLQVVHVWIQPSDRYREPQGDSLKVNVPRYADRADSDWLAHISHRLRQFYFIGE